MEVASLAGNQHGSVGGFGGEAGGKEQKFVYWGGLSEKGNIGDYMTCSMGKSDFNPCKRMDGFSIVTIWSVQSTWVKNV